MFFTGWCQQSENMAKMKLFIHRNRVGHHSLHFLKSLLILLAIVFSMVAVIGNQSMSMAAEDVVIAVGKGFKLTQGDVDKVRAYYDKTAIRTTDDEYVEGAFKIKIVAHEAMARQLDKELNIPPAELDKVESWLKLSELCYKQILEEYPVSDLVIESYYRAFPERFIEEGGSVDPVQKPLDAETRKKIRNIIVSASNDAVLSETIENLKKKYDVQFFKKQGNG